MTFFFARKIWHHHKPQQSVPADRRPGSRPEVYFFRALELRRAPAMSSGFNEVHKVFNQFRKDKSSDEGKSELLKRFEETKKRVQGQLDAIKEIARTSDLPSKAVSDVEKYKKSIKTMDKFVDDEYEKHSRGTCARILPLLKPMVNWIFTGFTVWLVRNDITLTVILATGVVLFLIVYFFGKQWKFGEYFDIWRGKMDKDLEYYCKKLEKYYQRLRDIRNEQVQLRKARTFDVRSSLASAPEVLKFWTECFGAKKGSVATAAMVQSLLFLNKGDHLVGSNVELFNDTIASIIDSNDDGLVSPTELLRFLQLFGPLDRCVERVKESLIERVEGHDSDTLVPWFTWRNKDRQQLEDLFKEYAVEGDFVVRCSSTGGFAVTKKTTNDSIRHTKIKFDLTGDPEKPYVYGSNAYASLRDLVKNEIKDGTPFMDPDTDAFFAVGNETFQVKAKNFMSRGFKGKFSVKVKKTLLGDRYFDVKGEFGRPKGRFWKNTKVGRCAETAIFFNRDPRMFDVVLNWYRYKGKLFIPSDIPEGLVRRDLEFFKIPFQLNGGDTKTK